MWRRALVIVLLLNLLSGVGVRRVLALPPPYRRAAPPCGARIAVLGADMSAGGRFEVQRALHVGTHTVQRNETLADEEAAAHGLIPARWLGRVAISSGLLQLLPRGSGLTVTLNDNIVLQTAQGYANALLTAGVTDAEVRVAAPTSQQAYGTTALLGLLRAAGLACRPPSPTQQELAIREIVLSSELAVTIGRQAAPTLLFALKGDAVLGGRGDTLSLSTLLDRDAGDSSVIVPAALRPTLITFLHDLVSSGAYRAVATAHLTLRHLNALTTQIVVATSGRQPGTPILPTATGVGIPTPFHGLLVAQRGDTITVQLPDRTIATYTVASTVAVTRAGAPTTRAALQPGDSVTVTTDAGGQVVALSVGAAVAVATKGAAPTQQGAPTPVPNAAATSGLNAAVIAVLAALLLLALLIAPLLVGVIRRRSYTNGLAALALQDDEDDGSSGESDTTERGPAARAFSFVPKGVARAPFKRRRPR